ncbi:cupredoxin domain-containing protein [Natrononativus amylolyticus]|uniref:cupredoxin domain-containing protein n=1 Tax=Natrononativus amylolyticus TaxID=2963434 RepID=UPI0020CE1E06|nr:plastocyanin/azurin family copper-binding protein [Natrononativus amylolyticus]
MNPLKDDDPLSRRVFLVGTAAGAAAVGVSATALAQEDDEENGDDEDENGDDEDEENGDEEDDGDGDENGGGGTEHIEIGDNYYEPESVTVEPGTTVVWEWVGDIDHNINPTSQPDDADWEGHPDLISDGEYEFTFDVEGEYAYTCDPHPGMDGTVVVDPDGGGAAEGPAEVVPDAAWTLVIATVAGMVSTLSLVYFFMRYGGESQ